MSKTMRICVECGGDIGERRGAMRCSACAKQRKLRLQSERRQNAQQTVQAPAPQPKATEPYLAPQNVQEAVLPLPLRVSVLDIARDVAFQAETRGLVRAVLALSPERQDLLRRLLEDAEVPA